MGNFFYPRTIEVGGNLSGSGLAENPTGLKPNINISSLDVSNYISSSDVHISNNLQVEGNAEINTLSASNGLSSSFFYGDGTNIININPGNVDFSGLLSDISSSFGQSANISASFGLKTDISSSFAELSKTAGQTFAGPITASSLGVGTPVNAPYVDNQQIAQFRRPGTVGSMISVRSGDAQINIGAGAAGIDYNWINSKNSSNGGRDLRLEMGDGQSKVIIKSDGKVGIGTTAPSTPLSIGPTPQAQINSNELLQISNTTTNDAYMTARSNEAVAFFGAYQDNAFVGSQTDNNFVLTSNHRTRMCVTNDGKVGVGTDFITPDELLHVNGNLKVNNDFIVGSDYDVPPAALIYANNTQFNVGIGTSTPDTSKRLHVVGESKFNGNMTLSGSLLLQSGNGISFAAFSSATGMTDELLDDYEEGTWTPSTGGSGWSGTNITFSDSRYIKIGSLVNIWTKVEVTGVSEDLGTTKSSEITGLPFSAVNNIQFGGVVSCEKASGEATAQSGYILNTAFEFAAEIYGGKRAYYVFASYRV